MPLGWPTAPSPVSVHSMQWWATKDIHQAVSRNILFFTKSTHYILTVKIQPILVIIIQYFYLHSFAYDLHDVWYICLITKRSDDECFMESLKMKWTYWFVTRLFKEIFFPNCSVRMYSLYRDMIVLWIKQPAFASYMWQHPKGVQYITKTAHKLASHIIYYEPHMWQII